MGRYRPTDSDVSTGEWLGDPCEPEQMTAALGPPSGPPPDGPRVPEQVTAPEQVPAEVYVDDEAHDAGETRQRERFGGLNWGAGFFGFVVTAGLSAGVSGAVAAGVAALGLTDEVLPTDPPGVPGAATIAAAAVPFAGLLLACFAGGYVAGRMSRFDGGRQGLGVWLTGLLLGGIAVCLGIVARSRWGGLQQLSLPAMPAPPEAALRTAAIGAAAILLGSLLMTVVGGKVGCRYHGKVDQAAYE